jgi:hypothetical protein
VPQGWGFVCHLTVDLGCHWGVGFLDIGVDGCPGARDFVLLRALDSLVNLGSASGVPLRPGWSNNALRPTKLWWPLLCSMSLDTSGNLGSASGIPLRPEWSNNAVQLTGSWWPLLPRSLGGNLAA